MQQSTLVETRVTNGVGVMDISGDVTSFSESILQQAYDKFTADGIKKLCLNFEKVSYINSAGMAVIINVLTLARKQEQSLRAWGLTEHFQKIFDMVGITKYMDHFGTEEEALRDF